MIADRGRISAYAQALKARVKPDSVVLDIGTGTGIWALLACQYGARKVYAVEPDDIILLAKEAAAANGFAGRIEFIQGVTTEVELPEKVDLVVSDIRGVLPVFQQSIVSILDARDRLLTPGGSLIPRRDTMWAALVDVPLVHRDFTGPWRTDDYGLDLGVFRTKVVNSWRKTSVKAADLVTEPACWATLDYETLRDLSFQGDVAWTIPEERTAHGICVWFDSEVAENIELSNSPLSPDNHNYGRAFFPWPEPVAFAAGDQVLVALRADYVGSDYVWGWRTRVLSKAGDVKSSFQQSTFLGLPLSADSLRRRAHTFHPQLNRQGEIDRMILDQMSAGAALGEIAGDIATLFPAAFKTRQDALSRVGELSAKYSQ
ncbi:MAG: 50S ribosomal protein L11 methyltransferase [Bryobacterales bacterium]|nr:50S ribosomal protein L11 methyltransferase [Bryobacterales bacterium]